LAEAIALTPRRAGVLVALITAAAGALALNRHLVGVFYDDGLYAGIAVALARGLGYVHPHLSAASPPAVVHYPPLYPLVLAPLFGAFSVPTAAYLGKVLNVVLAGLGAGLVAWHATRARLLGEDTPPWLAPAVVAAAAISIPVLATQAVLFSEPLFGVLLATAVILADAPPQRLSAAGAAGLAGLAAALALLTRSIGVAAGAGIVLFLLYARRAPRKTALAAAAPVFVAGAGWGLWVLAHRRGIDPALALNYGSYLDTIHQAGLGVFWPATRDLLRPLGDLTLGWLPSRAVYYPFAAAGVAVGGYGVSRLVPRSSVGWSLILYLAILAVWPFPSDRFLWGVLPWLGLAWVAGAMGLWRYQRLRLPVLLLSAALIVGYGLAEVRGVAGRWWGTTAQRISANFSELLPWLESLPQDAVLATDDEALVWLYTGRTAVPFYLYGYRGRVETRPSPQEQRAYLERQGVTHVLLSGFGSGSDVELDALLGAYPGWLTIVRRWSGGRAIFRVNRVSGRG
jgi:hypothetical protein